jgi:predicted dehydrogenase
MIPRRGFVASAALSALASTRTHGANNRLRLALAGCGTRGNYVAGFMAQMPDVEFAGFADPYLPNAEESRGRLNPAGDAVQDFRRLLDRKDIDAVVVATPDHWHASIAVLAARAGKDVFIEKPLSHNIREGQAMVRAARETGRILMAGLQHRSAPHFAECAQMVAAGALGDVRFVRIWNTINCTPLGIGHDADCAPPPGLDWDLYLGPAPRVPYNCKRFLATFRWFFDYSGGYITDFGTHRFDTVHQIMNVAGPLSVNATGGRFSVNDAGDVPDVHQATYEYPGFVLSYEGLMMNGFGIPNSRPRNCYNTRGPWDRPNGISFHGTRGTLFADRTGFEFYPEIDDGMWPIAVPAPQKFRGELKVRQGADATRIHAQRFPHILRTRELPPDISVLTGHRATVAPLLGNISYKTGEKLRWNPEKEVLEGASKASEALLGREMRKPYNLI